MRPLRRAVLGALVTTVTAIGGVGLAPPASAETAAIEWRTWTARVQPWQTVDICAVADGDGDGDSFEPGQTVSAQVRLNGAWVQRRSVTVTDAPRSCVSFAATALVPRPGTYTVRAVRTGPSAPRLESSRSLTFVPERTAVFQLQHALYFHTGMRGKKAPAEVSTSRGQRVELQRKVGTRWVTVGRATAPRVGSYATVRVPVPTRAGNARYRLVNRETTWSTRSVSQAFLIHQTDSAKHRGYLAAARRQISRYCPKTPIYVDIPEVSGAGPYGTIGLAWVAWQGDRASGGWMRTGLALRSGLTGKGLQHTALHECGHIVQYRAIVEDKFELERDRAWQLWPRVGHEGQAECMALQFSRAPERLYYVSGCSSRQMDSARRMWRTYGPKYHPGFYRWGPAAGTAAAAVPDRSAPIHVITSH